MKDGAIRHCLPRVIPCVSVLLFCLYFTVVPHLDILPWFDAFNEKRILELFLLLVVLALFICHPASRENWLMTLGYLPVGGKILLFGIAFLGIVSSINAAFPKFALLEVSLFTLLFAVTICIASCRTQLGDLFDKMMALAVFVLGWLCFMDFLGYYLFILNNGPPFSQQELFRNFSNIRMFNQVQSWTLSLIVVPLLLFTKRSFFITVLFITVAISWWLLLFTSGSRATLVGCLVAIPVTLLVFGKQAKDWFRWQAIAITGGVAGYYLFFFLIPEIMSVDFRALLESTVGRNMTYTADRLELWSSAVQMVQSSPWLGIGPMHYAARTNTIATHPHNALLQIAAEWGLPVVLAVIVLFTWGLYSWIKSVKSTPSTIKDKNVYAALFASLLTAAVNSLFDGVIVMPLSQVIMVLVIGWILDVAFQGEVSRAKHSALSHFAVILMFLSVMIGVTWPLFPEVLCLEKWQAEFMTTRPPRSHLQPRFWVQGDLNGYIGTVNCRE